MSILHHITCVLDLFKIHLSLNCYSHEKSIGYQSAPNQASK